MTVEGDSTDRAVVDEETGWDRETLQRVWAMRVRLMDPELLDWLVKTVLMEQALRTTRDDYAHGDVSHGDRGPDLWGHHHVDTAHGDMHWEAKR